MNTLTYPSFFDFGFDLPALLRSAMDRLASFVAPDKPFVEGDFDDADVLPEADIARPTREEIETRQKGVLSKMFGDEDETSDGDPPPPPPKKEPEKKPEPPKKEKPKAEEKPEDEEGTTDDDADEDYEGGLDPDEEKDEPAEEEAVADEDDAEEEEPESGDRETRARVEAKKNGQLLKAEKARAAQLLLDKKVVEDRLKDAETRLEEFNKLTIDPRSTPEYLELNERMWADVDTAVAEELPAAASGLSDKFSGYMKTYLSATRMKVDERKSAIDGLKSRIVSDMGGFTDPYSELLDDEKVAADTLTKEVLAVIRRNAPRAEEMISLESKLRNKAKVGRLVQGARDYERSYGSLLPALEGLGNLPDNLVEENPYSPEAVLTQLVKSNEKLAKKLGKSKADVLEVIMGPKPITDKEYETLEEQGVDIKEFLQTKEKAFAAKRAKLLPVIVKALAVLPFANKAMETLAREEREALEKREELETLGSIESKRKAVVTKEKAKPKDKIPASQRPLAISQFLGGGFED